MRRNSDILPDSGMFSRIRIVVDTDRIDALAADRAALWERVSNAAFLTLNEKREAIGYAPIEGGDRLE